MRRNDSSITVQGGLALVAVGAMLSYAVYALEIGPTQPVDASTVETISQAGSAQTAGAQAGAASARAEFYTGMVVKNGSGFLLRGSAGALYHLDDSTKAQAFAGKSVKVTGKLDETSKLIHVEKIEESPV